MRNLYSLLGLQRDATAAEIKKAYRKAAKAAHPDAGGTAEAMAELAEVFAVLSDPERRAHYDATGTWAPVQPVNPDAEIYGLIAKMIGQAMRDALDAGKSFENRDLRKFLLLRALGAQVENAETLETIATMKAEGEKLLGKFRRTSEGENIMDGLIKSNLEDIKRAEAPHLVQRQQIERVIELLEDYEFDFTAPAPEPHAEHNAAMIRSPYLFLRPYVA